MALCTDCGAEFPGSRYCTQCGADQLPGRPAGSGPHDSHQTGIADPTGTGESHYTVQLTKVQVAAPFVPEIGPSPAQVSAQPPPAAAPVVEFGPPPAAAPMVEFAAIPPQFASTGRPQSRRRVWIAAAAALVTVAALIAIGLVVLNRPDNDTAGTSQPTAPTVPVQEDPSSGQGDAGQGGAAAAPGGSDTTPQPEPSPDPTPAPTRQIPLQVSASSTAPDSVDDQNLPITYGAANTVDNNPATAWRAEGDGVGQELLLTLAPRTRVTSVGLIPGYDKIDAKSGVDRFPQNRRITKVSWSFDDGTVVEQNFTDSRSLQSIAVAAATTTTVRLRIIASTPPTAADPRNLVAISEIGISGTR